jgi:UDP-GlcNAc:undecaprenyl-phosphate GlcNAc-1-phosphate transferase
MTPISFFLALLISFVTTPILRKVALRFGIVDNPGLRKIQKEPVPLLGGAAVYLAVVLCTGINPLYDKGVAAVLIGGTLIFIVSLIDDKMQLSARLRLLVQLLAATLLVVSGCRVEFLPNNLFGHIGDILITLIWILGITNAFNCLDGLDGLCSGLGVICAFFFFLILYLTQQWKFLLLSASMMGACLGFLPHNFKKEKIFLGDAGSMFIGFTIAGLALLGSWASDNIIKLSVPILVLGVPIFDMTFTTIMRYREKKIRTLVEWLEYAGRDHFHHYLMDLGLHSRGAVYFIYAISVEMGISALIITKSDRAFYGILTIFKSMIMFGVIGVLMVLGRRAHKSSLVRDRMGI